MLWIDNKIISLDLFEKHFICDLSKCLGVCCVHGDSGAPLEEDEKKLLKKELPAILPYLSPEGRYIIETEGVAVIDHDNELVTPLIGNRGECAYSYFSDKGICFCGIEKAYFEGKTGFCKPISCHLYPIRTKQFTELTAINYDQWSICAPAREKGLKEGVPVFRFLKEPIIRKWGEDFYLALEDAYIEMNKESND
ncbi:MAG: DUF3109 family protein [Prevotellaceae bacterium]|nr:DUF3109 family protein [Prevotellaceae bacterium]